MSREKNRRSGAGIINDTKLEALADAGANRVLAALSPANVPVELLDFSKPPPGYEVGNSEDDQGNLIVEDEPHDSWRWNDPGDLDFHSCGGGETRGDVTARAWAHHESRRDPPGMEVIVHPDGDGFAVLVDVAGDVLAERWPDEVRARSAAWAWYKPRAAIVAALKIAEVVERTFIADNLWPRALTWSNEHVQEVQFWLDSPPTEGVELPEVLRG